MGRIGRAGITLSVISPPFRTLANPASREEEEHLVVSLASALSGAARFRHEGLALIVRRAIIAPRTGVGVGDGP